MRIKYISFLSGILLSFAAVISASAAPQVTVDKNYSAGELYVSVSGDDGEGFAVLMLKDELKPGELIGSLTADNVAENGSIKTYYPGELMGYAGECVAGDVLNIGMKVSGKYTIYITSAVSGETTAFPVSITSKNDYINAIEALNAGIDSEDEFYSAVLESKDMLGFDFELSAVQRLRDITDLLLREKDGEPFSETEYKQNTLLYNLCATIDALNKGIVSDDEAAVVRELIDTDETLKLYYGKHITDKARQTVFIKKLTGRNITSVADLKEKITEALILSVVQYHDGYMNIQTLFKSYKALLNINTVTNRTDVYKQLAGSSFNSIEQLTARYKSLCDSADTSSGTGGGSGGGGGGGGGGMSSSSKSVSGSGALLDSSNVSIERSASNGGGVYMPFKDLDTVEWAYEAISALSDAGIISGKSDTRFAPRDNVRREEFVKMIIGVIGAEQVSSGDKFIDVSRDDWFDPFVGAAVERGIVNGIEDNVFGTGLNITRQDMAVMVYNSLKTKDIELQSKQLSFDDAYQIADYAKEAVAALAGAGIINGKDNNIFDPGGQATRAEAAKIAYEVYRIIK